MAKASLIIAAIALLAAAAPVPAQDRASVVSDMKVLLDNECVRMQFHDVAVGETTPLHSHPRYAVYVFNPYKARITLADGSRRISDHEAGDAFWLGASRHVVENIGNTPIHNLVLELKPGSTCLADDPQITPEERFGELESKWMDALADKDVGALEQLLADEFTIIGVGSPLEDPIATRQQWLEVGLERPFPRHAVRILSVHELQDAAVVHGILTADYPPMPWIPEGGTLNFLVTDTWIYRDGRWQVVARHSSLPAKSGAP